MWDWMSVSTDDEETWDKIINCPLLDFQLVSRYGELLISKAECQGVKFELRERTKKVWIGFSPHKLYNDLHGFVNRAGQPMNHDTFTPDKLKRVFLWLGEHFALKPDLCHLHHVEFGINLHDLNLPSSTILKSLIAYGAKPFRPMDVKGPGNGRGVNATQYKLKIYDKALQNMLPREILRFEFKATKMQSVKKVFPKYPHLSNLLESSLWWKCKDKLLSVLDLCIFDDQFNVSLTDEQMRKLFDWRNPRIWEAMPAHTRCRNKKAFEYFIGLHGELKIKQAIKDGIEREACKMLTGNDGV